jgi:hypothetical protein
MLENFRKDNVIPLLKEVVEIVINWDMKRCIYGFLLLLFSCKTPQLNQLHSIGENRPGASVLYKQMAAMNWRQRDSVVLSQVEQGNVPTFYKNFSTIHLKNKDSVSGKVHQATVYVASDYLVIGTNADWARVNITPGSAQLIADKLNCFLPTVKLVDQIYAQAKIKLEPIPMYAFRDSTPTMYQHHLIIEGQRKNKKGLVAGIKKDLVLTEKLVDPAKKNKVAIYGWHQLNGKPIQPLYTGHVYWWVDYSQGVRLISKRMKVDGKWMQVEDVMQDDGLRSLLTYDSTAVMLKYPTSGF